MQREILITGATGNVGLELARLCHDRGLEADAAVRDPGQTSVDLPPGMPTRTLDFLNPSTFEGALRGVRKVFLVRPPAISNVKRDMRPFLQACETAGVEHMVFLSLLGAERLAVVPHRKIELEILRIGIPYTFLRPSFFMQNLSTTHRSEIRDGIFRLPAGEGKTSFIDVRDIAEVALVALTSPCHLGRSYNLTGARALDYHEVAAILSRKLQRPVQYRSPSALQFFLDKWREGNPLAYAAVITAIYSTARLGKAAEVSSDLERLLGRPPISFERFVEDHLSCWTG